jgi:hypothetical protein
MWEMVPGLVLLVMVFFVAGVLDEWRERREARVRKPLEMRKSLIEPCKDPTGTCSLCRTPRARSYQQNSHHP